MGGASALCVAERVAGFAHDVSSGGVGGADVAFVHPWVVRGLSGGRGARVSRSAVFRDCPVVYSSGLPVREVLSLRGGSFGFFGLQAGARDMCGCFLPPIQEV